MDQAMINDIDNWRFDDKRVVAAVIHKEVMANRIFQRKFNVLPGEAGVWINNGRIEKIVTEDQVVTSGVVDRVKSKFGAGQDMILLMMDLSERVLQFNMGINSASLNEHEMQFTKRQLRAYGKNDKGNYIYQELISAIDEKLNASKEAGEKNEKKEPDQASQEKKTIFKGDVF